MILSMGYKMIKWTFRALLFFIGLSPLSRCGAGYRNQEGKIKFNGKEISDKNFEVLNGSFGKNDTAVFYKEHLIEGADPGTFTALDDHYAKDENKVFYCNEERESQNYYLTQRNIIFKINDADPQSFDVLGDQYAKDKSAAYYKGLAFGVKDPDSLNIIEARFLKDRFRVYFDQKTVENADPSSFQIMNNHYARDRHTVYYYGAPSDFHDGIHPIPCKADEFVLLDFPYSRDRESAYFYHEKIEGSHAGSFQVLGYAYSKDKNFAYLEKSRIKAADPASFSILEQDENSIEVNYYSKDKKHIFWKDKFIENANHASFQVLALGYSRDSHRVYFENRPVKNADPSSFTVSTHPYGDYDAEDRFNKYAKGVKIE